MEGSDRVVGGGVGEVVKAVCVKKLVKGGFEASCVGVRRKMIRRILMKLAKAGGYSRAAGGGGEMERFEEGGEKVYKM